MSRKTLWSDRPSDSTHEQVEIEAAAWLLFGLLPVEVQGLTGGVCSHLAFTLFLVSLVLASCLASLGTCKELKLC